MSETTSLRAYVWEAATSIALAVAFAFAFQTAAFATYYIPSESMVPTLLVGDRLAVSKFAYGWSRFSLPYELQLPQAVRGRLLAQEPSRGDVVVFVHPRTGERMIKRVIGLPGDRVAIKGGHVVLNGQAVERRFLRSYSFREYKGRVVRVSEFAERLPGGRPEHTILERSGEAMRTDMEEVTLPLARYFMMGDNRDNSLDSRFPEMGLVPEENLIGKAETILYSWYSCTPEPGTECGSKRFVTRIK